MKPARRWCSKVARRRICLAPKNIEDQRPHRRAAFRMDKLDQDVDRLGHLLLLGSVRVSEVVAMVLEVFGDAGVDLVEEAHGTALCSNITARS